MMTLEELDKQILNFAPLEDFVNESCDNNGWYANWSGSYPCLCAGEWTLYHNGEKIDVEIPFKNKPADTYNEYAQWYFGGESGWEEEWDFYEEGYYEENWIKNNVEYLKQVTSDESQYMYIYKAFQNNDWRYGSCGGCI